MEQCVVDNRVFLLGLDALYRAAMKRHERTELLDCARAVAAALSVHPADVPIEGYYSEEDALTEYFRLVRALQATPSSRIPEVARLSAYRRLKEIVASSLFGQAQDVGKLLPFGRDSLTQALDNPIRLWTVPALTAAAAAAVRVIDDCSLVGLAARAEDAVVLAALRESVALYAMTAVLSRQPRRAFVWAVDPDLANAAQRFIDTFNDLLNEQLPAADATHAEEYWEAHDEAAIVGRCVCLGHDLQRLPRYYHWAVCRDVDGHLTVQDFWQQGICTTKAYRTALKVQGRCPELPLRVVSRDPDTFGDIAL